MTLDRGSGASFAVMLDALLVAIDHRRFFQTMDGNE